MSGLFEVTLLEQIACAERELKMRQSVYPRRVAERKMSQALADKETDAMLAILRTLNAVAMREGKDATGH